MLTVAQLTKMRAPLGPTPQLAGRWEWVTSVLDGGVGVITLLGAAVVTAVAGGSATRNRRPLGLVWDLMCFLPRTAHPLGPPCYAERAVPEIVRRIEWWLDGEKPDGSAECGASERRVVLSAHSLGAVLAVATVCAVSSRCSGADTLQRTSLLTYGSQLRPYFGRLFPELLGSSVLGTAPVTAPKVRGEEPWSMGAPLLQAAPGAGGNVRSLLADRWWNLWRLTDPLGFSVDALPPQPNTSIDRAAEEFDTSTYVVRVDGHSHYACSLAYMGVLLAALPHRQTATEPDRGTTRSATPQGGTTVGECGVADEGAETTSTSQQAPISGGLSPVVDGADSRPDASLPTAVSREAADPRPGPA